MTAENINSPEEKKGALLRELAEFIVEANLNAWAAGKGGVEPTRKGFKRHVYERGLWKLDDEYTAYFKAPGMTIVKYKDTPAWTMVYGGPGVMEGSEKSAPEAFKFLRSTLMQATPLMPFRGPRLHKKGPWLYEFELEGDVTEFTWNEAVWNEETLVFDQMGLGGIAVGRDYDYNPIYPWDL